MFYIHNPIYTSSINPKEKKEASFHETTLTFTKNGNEFHFLYHSIILKYSHIIIGGKGALCD